MGILGIKPIGYVTIVKIYNRITRGWLKNALINLSEYKKHGKYQFVWVVIVGCNFFIIVN